MNRLIALALLAALATGAGAEQLVLPVGQQGNQGLQLPAKGLSMAQVASQFGEPEERLQPRGQPPISRWIYGDFVVYFEAETVIHSVAKHRPQTSTKSD